MMGLGTAWKTLLLLAVLALLFCGSGRLSTVLAQYPPPAGAVTVSVDETAPPTGGSVEVTCTVVDSAGAPVANEPCTFTVVSQPGADASLTSVTVVTDDDGVATATLYTGSTPGLIVVEVKALGVSSQVSVATGVEPGQAPPTGSTGTTSGAPAAVPASGAGGMAGSGPLYGPLAIGALVGAVVLAGAGAYIALKRRATI
jgi:hypothetical protein